MIDLLAVAVRLAVPVLVPDVILLHQVPALQPGLLTTADIWDN